ncbi:hypothetical protein KRX56_01715 [Dermabacteraceae bacterium TAE3-ERU27]|nr:hypothetical protein [Dermabacteraceae bacterium TAE3-ERU27]
MARAFTPSHAVAVLAYPLIACALIPIFLRKGLFIDGTRAGIVTVCRRRHVLDIAIAMPVVVVVFFSGWLILRLLLTDSGAFCVLLAAYVLMCLAATTTVSSRQKVSKTKVPELHGKECWEIANLAQMPGTKETALLLAREVISTIPPDAVIVTTPLSERLRKAYENFGFKPGPGLQMHMIAPPPETEFSMRLLKKQQSKTAEGILDSGGELPTSSDSGEE